MNYLLLLSTQIICTTGAVGSAVENAVVLITTERRSDDDALTYNYTTAHTPTVTEIDPTEGSEGDEVTITGTGFSTTDSDNTVMIGEDFLLYCFCLAVYDS